ncbi:MAG: FAD-dependent oxidoreductase [Chloroflexota bacterium]
MTNKIIESITPDVIVAGSGMAGLTAALSAQELGAQVVMLEKASEIGGSAGYSGGTVWTAKHFEDWLKVGENSDAELGRVILDSFHEGIPWLQQQGMQLKPVPSDRAFRFEQVAYKMMPDTRTAILHLADRFVAQGGVIRLNTALQTILQDDAGRVNVITALTNEPEPTTTIQLHTSALILATGGFQANPELRRTYFGYAADAVIVRGVLSNTGDGLLAAQQINGATIGPFDRCYGHVVPAPPAQLNLDNFLQIKPAFCHYAVFVNLNGERFDDEFLGDEVTVQALIKQPQGVGILIFDEAMRRNRSGLDPSAGGEGDWPEDSIDVIRQIGGQILQADTLDDLVQMVTGTWAVDETALSKTVLDYNQACATNDASQLLVFKSGGLDPISTPPFYAIKMLPGVTFTYGGLKVNTQAQVLNQQDQPIPGLFAAGADVGGIYTRGYVGGLAMSLALGRLAGKGAAKSEN